MGGGVSGGVVWEWNRSSARGAVEYAGTDDSSSADGEATAAVPAHPAIARQSCVAWWSWPEWEPVSQGAVSAGAGAEWWAGPDSACLVSDEAAHGDAPARAV